MLVHRLDDTSPERDPAKRSFESFQGITGLILNPLADGENTITLTFANEQTELQAVVLAYTGCNVNTSYADGNWPPGDRLTKPTDISWMFPPLAGGSSPLDSYPNSPFALFEPVGPTGVPTFRFGLLANCDLGGDGSVSQPNFGSPMNIDPDEGENGFEIVNGEIAIVAVGVVSDPDDGDASAVTGWDHWNGGFTTLQALISLTNPKMAVVYGEQPYTPTVENLDMSGAFDGSFSIGSSSAGIIVGLQSGPGPTWPPPLGAVIDTRIRLSDGAGGSSSGAIGGNPVLNTRIRITDGEGGATSGSTGPNPVLNTQIRVG